MAQWLWQQDRNLASIGDTDVKLLSCDIFDTLVFRTTETPQELFTLVGQEAMAQGILRAGITPEEFKQLRIIAEQEARKVKEKADGCGEIDIYEIYDQLPVGIGSHDELLKLELTMEKKCLYLNPSILSLLQYMHVRQIPVVLLSDMYLLPRQLKDLLTSIGFDWSIVTEIIVSNQYHTSKWNEGLYQVLLDKYPHILPENITHIGDNYFSDVQKAQMRGIHSLYYNCREEKGTIYELERYFKNSIVPELLSIRKLSGNMTQSFAEQDKFWFEFGATIVGPLLSVFTEWVLDIAIKEHIPRIYPLMREGGIIAKFVDNSLRSKEIDDIHVKPLYISRRSSYLPSLHGVNEEAIKKSILEHKVNTVFTRFKMENIFPEYGNLLMSKTDSVMLDSGKTLFEAIHDYMFSPANMAKIKSVINSESELFIDYLINEYEMADHPFMTIDIGYNGTMQTVIDQIVRNANYSYKSIHLVILAYQKTLQKMLEGIDIRGFISETMLGRQMVTDNWTPGIIEVVMMECIGSTIGYQKSECGAIGPVLDKIEGLDINRREREVCREGMLCFQALFLNLLKQKPWIKDEIFNERTKLFEMISRFMEYPTWAEANNLGNLNHEDFFGGEGFSCFCPPQLSEDAKLKEPSEFLKRRLDGYVWMSGIAEKAFPNYFLLQLLNTTDQNRSFKKMVELAGLIYKKDIKELVVYGAGEMGTELVRILKTMNIRIIGVVDRNEKLWGKNIEGIKIYSLDDALRLGMKSIAIASYAFAKEIRESLEKKFDENKIQCDIFDLYS